MKFLIPILVLFGFSSSQAGSKIGDCQGRPDFSSQGQVLTDWKNLPKMVLVGQSVQYYVESKNGEMRIWGEQSFIKGESKIRCASMDSREPQSFSIYAPTLIDLREMPSRSNSYWQFHMTVDAEHFGIWNQKSLLFSKVKDLEEAFRKIGAKIQIIQVSHDQYELVLVRERESWTETLAIRFDALTDLP